MLDTMGTNNQNKADRPQPVVVMSSNDSENNIGSLSQNSLQHRLFLALCDSFDNVELKTYEYGVTEYSVDGQTVSMQVHFGKGMPAAHFKASEISMYDWWANAITSIYGSVEKVELISPSLSDAFIMAEIDNLDAAKFFFDNILIELGIDADEGIKIKGGDFIASDFYADANSDQLNTAIRIAELVSEYYSGKIPGYNVKFSNGGDFFRTLRIEATDQASQSDMLKRGPNFTNAVAIVVSEYDNLLNYLRSHLTN